MLLIRPKPFEDESLSGYITRIFEINKYESMIIFLKKASLYGERLVFSPYMLEVKQLENLAELTNVDIQILFKSISPIFNSTDLKEESLQFRYAIHTKKIKICPKCLLENGYHKKIWNLSLVTICPFHNCLLVDICPNCNKFLKIYSDKLTICNCGFNLLNSPQVEVPYDQTLLTILFYNALGYSIEYNLDLKENPLYNMEAIEMTNIIMFLAKFFEVNKTTYRYRSIMSSKTKNILVHELVVKILQIFSNWPESFYDFLKKFDSKHKKKGMVGQFGNLYLGLMSDATKNSFLFNEFNIYLSKYWSATVINRKNRDQFSLEYIHGSEASQMIGCHIETLKTLVRENKIIGEIRKKGNGSLLFINKVSLKLFLDSEKHSKSNEEVVEILNINRDAIISLVDKGILMTQTRNKNKKIIPKSIDELLKCFFAVSSELNKSINLITLTEASFLANRYGSEISIVDIIKDVIDGRIKKVYRVSNGEKGLRAFMYSKETIRSLYSNNYLLSSDIAVLKNVKYTTVSRWIKNGVLPAKKYEKYNVYRITIEDYQKFIACYSTYNELVKELNLAGYDVAEENIKDNLNLLRSLKITPVAFNRYY